MIAFFIPHNFAAKQFSLKREIFGRQFYPCFTQRRLCSRKMPLSVCPSITLRYCIISSKFFHLAVTIITELNLYRLISNLQNL